MANFIAVIYDYFEDFTQEVAFADREDAIAEVRKVHVAGDDWGFVFDMKTARVIDINDKEENLKYYKDVKDRGEGQYFVFNERGGRWMFVRAFTTLEEAKKRLVNDQASSYVLTPTGSYHWSRFFGLRGEYEYRTRRFYPCPEM